MLLGNFLYLNVIVLPLSLLLFFSGGKKYIIVAFLSLFFLYFTGIKSYLFQSFILMFFIFSHGLKFRNIIFFCFIMFFLLFTYFFFYDYYIDKASIDLLSTLDRFLAYFSGSWGTFYYYLKDGWETPYFGLSIFFPIYKIVSLGAVSLADYNRFYDVNGFNLNVIPFFQLAYLEGGSLFQSVVIFSTSLFYSFIRYLAITNSRNIYYRVLLFYFSSTFLISSLFANVFSDLPVYIVIFFLLLLGAFSDFRMNRIR